jgi:hypothetical protein
MSEVGHSNQSRLTDAQIRKAIHAEIIPTLIGDSESRVLDEMAICSGEARIDIAVINGHLHGLEIKSDVDTLERLQGQAATYSRVFDTVTIICGESHVDKVIAMIPEWWGIYSAKVHFGSVRLTRIRCFEFNENVERYSLAQLLWKPELTTLLSEAGIKKGISNKPCRELWKIVSDTFPTPALQIKVRELLKIRACWRLAPQQT